MTISDLKLSPLIQTSDSRDFEQKRLEIQNRIIAIGDNANGTLTEKLNLLGQLTEFEYGRYRIMNNALNARWSHYSFYEFPLLKNSGHRFHPLELQMLTTRAAESNRQRIPLVQSIISQELFEGINILSIPCGVMADLLTLDYSRIGKFSLVGIDLDKEALILANAFADQQGLQDHCQFLNQDAWNLKLEYEFDCTLSIGLNMYSPSIEIAMSLYSSLFRSIKEGGKLVLSYMTPDLSSPESERDASLLEPEEIKLFRLLSEVFQSDFNRHLVTSKQIVSHLMSIGFKSVKCYHTDFRAFNIAVATK